MEPIPGTRHPSDRPFLPPQVLDRVRAVAAAKGKNIACLLDTKGPEIRTAMLKDGKNIELQVRWAMGGRGVDGRRGPGAMGLTRQLG